MSAQLHDHTHKMPDGTFVTCRQDGVIQIENTEVSVREIQWLAAHVGSCEVLPKAKATKRSAARSGLRAPNNGGTATGEGVPRSERSEPDLSVPSTSEES